MTAHRYTTITCNGPDKRTDCTAGGPTFAASISAPFPCATAGETRDYATQHGWAWVFPDIDQCPDCRQAPAALAAREAVGAGLRAALTEIRKDLP